MVQIQNKINKNFQISTPIQISGHYLGIQLLLTENYGTVFFSLAKLSLAGQGSITANTGLQRQV